MENDLTSNLTSLIDRYKTDLPNIHGENEFAVFKNFYNYCDKNIAYEWLNEIFKCETSKCNDRALKFRDEGNIYFKEKRFFVALKCYTESLSFSPYDDEGFCLALANRSAVFYVLKEYQSCVDDIIMCLDLNYPLNLKYKIYIRLANCYLKLRKFDSTTNILNTLNSYLDDVDVGISQEKIVSIKVEMDYIEGEVEKGKISNEIIDFEANQKNVQLPNLKDGENKTFLSASKALNLKYNESHGRYVVANKAIKMGDVLFVEKAFAFVPILTSLKPEEVFDEKCYHCLAPMKCPLPCKLCTTLFCCQKCRDLSNVEYHKWECLGSCIDIWKKIGVNFLALRMLLQGKTAVAQTASKPDITQFGNTINNYPYVCGLVTNIDKMKANDILPHVVSAMMITLYLKRKTDYFDCLITVDSGANNNELLLLVGSTLLKHILQVISNASTIESVHNEFYTKFNGAEQISDAGIFVHAVGIYPSVSMMNHSCDTNVTNYFCNDYIIVKANRDIAENDEIFNSYGYDCRQHSTEERQDNLKNQHYFVCKCTPCTHPTKPEIFHDGLLCQKCKGCAVSIDEEQYKCTHCEHEFVATNHFTYIDKADEYYEKYDRSGALSHLKKCIELREKVFYKYNFSMYTGNLDMQTHYGDRGNFERWWHYTQIALDMDKELLGQNSLRYAMNIRFAIIIILRFLSNLHINEKNKITKQLLQDLILFNKNMIQVIQRIFKLFYPENMIHFTEIEKSFDATKLITDQIIEKQLFEPVPEN